MREEPNYYNLLLVHHEYLLKDLKLYKVRNIKISASYHVYCVTGSTGAAGPRLFTIHLSHNMSTDSLPKAHTW